MNISSGEPEKHQGPYHMIIISQDTTPSHRDNSQGLQLLYFHWQALWQHWTYWQHEFGCRNNSQLINLGQGRIWFQRSQAPYWHYSPSFVSAQLSHFFVHVSQMIAACYRTQWIEIIYYELGCHNILVLSSPRIDELSNAKNVLRCRLGVRIQTPKLVSLTSHWVTQKAEFKLQA